jgi:hypothetical protein
LLRRPDAEKAIAGVNGTSIAPGTAAERVREGADNRKKSERRKDVENVPVADKAKARVVAVDWALSKDQWAAINATGGEVKAEAEGDEGEVKDEADDESEVELMVDEFGRAPGEASDGYLSEELSDSDESMFGDASGDEKADSDVEAVSDKKRGKASAEGMTLFVRNIQFEATEDELYAMCVRRPGADIAAEMVAQLQALRSAAVRPHRHGSEDEPVTRHRLRALLPRRGRPESASRSRKARATGQRHSDGACRRVS